MSSIKFFLGILNSLYEVMCRQGICPELGAILRQLTAYTTFHFATEEKYFDKFAYELAVEHKEQHRQLLAKVNEFNQRFDLER